MERITKKDVHGMFHRFIHNMNIKQDGGNYNGYDLDYYNGYIIVKYGDNGSESHPFGNIRRSTREMYLSLNLANESIESLNRGQ